MAVVAPVTPQDWKIHREDNMDSPQNTPGQTRQRSPSSNEPSQQAAFQQQAHFQQQQPQQQPFPFVQQQPGAWTPSASAQPFYPSYYHTPHQQQQQQFHGHSPAPQNQFFDPALAQWYQQQMMFNAQQQQHGFPRVHQTSPQQHRNGSDYFAPGGYNPFPSGTPPPHPNNPNFPAHRTQNPVDPQQQYPGFHPYRRPNRQQSTASSAPSDEWRAAAPHRPYARADAAGSSSSVNSSGSGHNGSRQRTDSMQSAHSGYNSSGSNNNSASPAGSRSRNGPGPSPQALPTSRTRTGSNPSSASSPAVTPRKQQSPIPHTRNVSSSSAASSSRSPNTPTSSGASTASTTPSPTATPGAVPRPARPSPLSQGNITASEKRMSRDDIDLAALQNPTPSAAMIRSGGLKGRLRRALSFNAAQTLKEEADEDEDDQFIRPGAHAGSSKLKTSLSASNIRPSMDSATLGSETIHDDGESTATVQKKKSRTALFSSKLNASTDNISLSSTVSSASVMIRKLGSMGRLARRNSLAGITSLFKDKKDKEDGEKDKDKKKKKKSAKGEASEPRVSEYTAEVDRSGSDWSGPEMNGLSPAAKLARQHTLKSNAEAAAKLKAQQDAAAKAQIEQANGTGAGVPTWDNNTTTRAGSVSPVKGGTASVKISEDGTRVLVEDDDDYSDDGHYKGKPHHDGWDDDDWGEEDGEEDVTIRQGLDRANVDDGYEETEPWAIDVRRSVERTKKPAKGILKYAVNFDQERHLVDQSGATSPATRLRANSYDSTPARTEPGPMAHMPTSDPDHIDGLQRHPSHSSAHSHSQSAAPLLPPLGFETASNSSLLDAATKPKESGRSSPISPHPEKANVMFNLPNSSAPALTMLGGSSSGAPPLTHRSATAPARRLAFANNLSIYDTFPSSVYDRRSEPATWSRLTPALAQRIKEELNSYKMEEMEVHAASRIHTQFFV